MRAQRAWAPKCSQYRRRTGQCLLEQCLHDLWERQATANWERAHKADPERRVEDDSYVGETVGCGCEMRIIAPRAATQHPFLVSAGIRSLSAVTTLVGVWREEAAGPLPHIACHVLCTTRTGACGIRPHRSGGADLARRGVAQCLVKGVGPGIQAPVRATRRLGRCPNLPTPRPARCACGTIRPRRERPRRPQRPPALTVWHRAPHRPDHDNRPTYPPSVCAARQDRRRHGG